MITALTLAPVVAAVLILALPERRARAVALAGALVSLTLAVWMLVQFNEQPGDLKFEEKVEWIPTLGIDYFVGLDGTNALVLLLSALLAPLVVLASWQHTDRPRTYFVLLSLLVWPQLNVRELLQHAVQASDLSAAVVLLGLLLFNGLSMIAFVLWLGATYGNAMGLGLGAVPGGTG
jgi:formate hydrogenlyase subunit 3/multisubunit Na+/H+ antiporter MnhD subunit